MPQKQAVPGLIWKVLPSFEEELLVIEVRKPDERTVSGFVLNLKTRSLTHLEVSLSWTDRLVAVHGGMAIWQGLADEGMPDPLGLHAVDLGSFTLAWSDPSVYFQRTGPEILLAGDPSDPNHVLFTDVKTGEVRTAVKADQVPVGDLGKFDQNRHSVLAFPTHLVPTSEEYQSISLDCLEEASLQIQGPVSRLQTDGLDILHVYHQKEEQIESSMIFRQADQKPLVLASGSYPTGYTIDPFFQIRDVLVWVVYPGTIGYMRLPY